MYRHMQSEILPPNCSGPCVERRKVYWWGAFGPDHKAIRTLGEEQSCPPPPPRPPMVTRAPAQRCAGYERVVVQLGLV